MRRVRAMKVLIAYYSRYGHILKMVRAVEEGVKTAEGVEAVLRRIEELPEIEKGLSKGKYAKATLDELRDTPIRKLDDLEQADCFVIGSPYGASTITGGQNNLVLTKEDLYIVRSLGKRAA